MVSYRIKIDHEDDGEINARLYDVGSKPEDRRRIAAALRIIADRVDPDEENWPFDRLN